MKKTNKIKGFTLGQFETVAGPVELLVADQSRRDCRDIDGFLLVRLAVAYGRPCYNQRWCVGLFGNSPVYSDPCDFVPVYSVDLTDDDVSGPARLLDNPLFREARPSRFSRIVNLWARFA